MAILIRPSQSMWDTWIFQDGEEYHLFYMSAGDIGRAVSRDLLHWRSLPTIRHTAGPNDWDAKGMTTGCTVQVGDTYYMAYGTGPTEPVGFLVSHDLQQWERYAGNPVLPSKLPYRVGDHWRDLSAYWDNEDQLWHAFLFGMHAAEGLPCVAHLVSHDYLRWEYLEPVFISEPYTRQNKGYVELEVPDYFSLGDKHYLLVSSVRSRKDYTSGRKDACGTWYLVADRRDGPYTVPDHPLLLGYGRGRHDHYVGRTLMYDGERLIYHHTWGKGPVCWGTLKRVCQEADGTLSLHYWPRLNDLVTETLFACAQFDVKAAGDQQELLLIDVEADDMMLTCRLALDNTRSAGIVWRYADGLAAGLLIEPETDTLSIVTVSHATAFNARTILCHLQDDYRRAGILSGTVDVRILARAHMAEVYINDQWMFCTDMSNAPLHGKVGVLVNSGHVGVENLRIAALEPLSIES